MRALLIITCASSVAAFIAAAPLSLASRCCASTTVRMGVDGGVDPATRDLWRPGEAVDSARNLLQLLDLWEEENDGAADECSLSDDIDSLGCCMIGPEPLEALCDRLDRLDAAPKLARVFEEVLKDAQDYADSSSEIPMACVTVDKMRNLIRTKLSNNWEPGTNYVAGTWDA